jgi:hypothetical protein
MSATMRPAPRRIARAASAGIVVAALVTALLPALPALAKDPIKVTGQDISTTVDHQRILPLPDGASHVALSWSGSHADHGTAGDEPLVTIAFGDAPNALGEEVAVFELHEDDGPDDVDLTAGAWNQEAGRISSGVIWTGGARFARITTNRPLGQVTVTTIDAQAEVGFVEGAEIHVARAAMTEPDIYSRAQWGADESLRFDSGGHEIWPPEFSPMQKAIVHHTAGRNNDPNPAATVRAIYYDKTVNSDFGDIGYNFLIDEQGRIYEGRYSREYEPGEEHLAEDLAGNIVRGGHARDFNDGTVGIALLGNFQNRQPTTAARNALEELLAWKLERHGLDPEGASTYTNPILGNTKFLNNISGHRNVNQTACPGDTFYPKFPGLRDDVADRIAATTGPGDDDTAPSVDSLTALATSPTGAHTIPFGLIFREPIEGLEPGDFEVTGSSNGWSVTDITGTASAYTIEVSSNSPNPEGSVELTLLADTVRDLAALTGPPDAVTETVEFVEDSDAPTVLLYQTPHKQYVRNGKLDYIDVTATFSEPVTGFNPNDVTIAGSSHDADPWRIETIFGEGAAYGFSLLNDSWDDGTLTFQIEDGIQDMAGNTVQPSNTVTMIFDRQDPSVSAPKTSLRSGVALDGNDLRVTISWTGDDDGPAGIDSYDVRRKVDGGSFQTIESNWTNDSLNRALDPGHTYRFKVRPTDNAGNVGPWKAGPTLRPRLLQQSHGDVKFNGKTVPTSFARYSGGSQRYLADEGAWAKLTTEARSLSFVTTKGPNRGEAEIYIDGELAATVDLNAADHTYRYVAYTRTWSSVGTHTIRVVAVGTPGHPRVDVDAFGVIR